MEVTQADQLVLAVEVVHQVNYPALVSVSVTASVLRIPVVMVELEVV